MLHTILFLVMIIYIISSGIGLFIRSIILTDKQNARNIFKSVLGSSYDDFVRADRIVSSMLIFAALLPIINTIFSLVFLQRVIARLWGLMRGFYDEQ